MLLMEQSILNPGNDSWGDSMNMERDITRYTKEYMADDSEQINVKYRRRKILEILDVYKPKNVVEVGCGIQPLFEFYREYDSFCIIEPSEEFCKIARSSGFFNKNVIIINDFLENAAVSPPPPFPDHQVMMNGILSL